MMLPPPPVDRCAPTMPPPLRPLPSFEIVRVCTCGCAYTAEEWAGLAYVGEQDDYAGGWLTLRNCAVCLSTISLPRIS